MAFRIPFSEHLVIEADTPAEVRALIAEFGVALSARALPASPPTAAVIDTGACARRRAARTAPRGDRHVAQALTTMPVHDGQTPPANSERGC
jgi:hypothetical protein